MLAALTLALKDEDEEDGDLDEDVEDDDLDNVLF